MRPLQLILTGFTGIRSGLGLETFELDLESIDPASQLIAIAGPNGCGKTTVLDNLVPYRVMASRASDPNPNAFSYYDNVGAVAEKILLWEHNGRRFESCLKFKQTGKTKKTEAYLFEYKGSFGGKVPVTLTDGTVSDGKTDTYDRCVSGILGSPALFFSSAFSAQGRRQMSAYRVGEVKALLTELLGLDRFVELSDQARRVAAMVSVPLPALRAELSRLDKTREALEIERAQSVALAADLEHATDARQQARRAVADASKALAEAQAADADSAAVRARRGELEQALQVGGARKSRVVAEAGADKHKIESRAQQDSRQALDKAHSLDAEKVQAEAQIDTLGRKAEAIRAAAGRAEAAIPAITREIAGQKETIDRARETLEKRNAAQLRVSELTGRCNTLVTEGRGLTQVETDLKSRCQLTREVPCQGTDLQGQCKLLADAVDAERRLPEVSGELSAHREQWHQANAELSQARAELEAITVPDIAGAERALQAAETRLAAAERERAAMDSLQGIEDHIGHLRGRIEAIAKQVADERATVERIEATRAADIADIDARLADTLRDLEAEMRAIQSDLDKLPVPESTAHIVHAQEAMEAKEKDLTTAEQTVADLHAKVAASIERASRLEAAVFSGIGIPTRVARLETEAAHWTTLAKGLGRDGIIALSIDDAGPTITALANDLLESCYGGRFAISINTQAAKKDGDLKETFEIVVHDSERGDSKPLSAMSGGEKVFVNETVSRAIALFMAQDTAGKYQTLFSDETDGPLDAGKKRQFALMKRRVLELGGFEREIFISHSPDVLESADVVINLMGWKQS